MDRRSPTKRRRRPSADEPTAAALIEDRERARQCGRVSSRTYRGGEWSGRVGLRGCGAPVPSRERNARDAELDVSRREEVEAQRLVV